MGAILRFLPNSIDLGANHVKMTEVRPILFAKKCSPKNLVLAIFDL